MMKYHLTLINAGFRHRNWYSEFNTEINKMFVNHDVNLIIDILAATSIRSTLESNVRKTIIAYSQWQKGEPFNGYLPVIKIQLERLRRGEGLSGRKIKNFACAMKGDKEAVVVDMWMMRAFDLFTDKNLGRPTDKQYTYVEGEVRILADKLNYAPCEIQAMMWCGIRLRQGISGTSYLTELNKYMHSLFPLF